MRMNRFMLAAAVALGLAFTAGSASAATVNYSGSIINMGAVSIGQDGVIDADHDGNLIVNNITGTLPAGSMISFSYNFAGDLQLGLLGESGSYSYTSGGHTYAGQALAFSPLGGSLAVGSVDGSPSTALVFASAQLDFVANTATAVIKNFSSGVVNYASLFMGLVGGNKDLQISYQVSAVPLPAALPLFGAGLGALVFGSRKRKAKAALAAA